MTHQIKLDGDIEQTGATQSDEIENWFKTPAKPIKPEETDFLK
jgi:hypothetical protein